MLYQCYDVASSLFYVLFLRESLDKSGIYDIINKRFEKRNEMKGRIKMSMKIEKTDKANELKLEFTIEAAKFDEAMKKVYAKTAKYFSIPGFRRGKAPMQMVEKQYGSSIFYEDTFNEIAPEIMEKELAENKIEAVSRPEIDIKQIGKGQDLIFTAVIQTKPEVKLGTYKGIAVEAPEYVVTEADIDHEISHMAERNARLVTVEDRPVEMGDKTTIDFEGFVEGKPFEGGKAENYDLEIGSNTFIPGFEDQIVGMKIDEQKDIQVKFPEEYFSKELAGKDATFKVTLHKIQKKELPTIDDEFAKDVSEFDSLKELKASIEENKKKENAERSKYETEENVIKAVCENVAIDIPSGMVETEIDNMMKDMEGRLSYQGLNMQQYLSMLNQTEADLRKNFEEQAKTSVKTNLVLEAVAKAEKIEASEEDVTARLKEMAEKYNRPEDEILANTNIRDYVTRGMSVEKTIDFLVKNAKTTVKKIETKHDHEHHTGEAKKTEKKAKTEKK